MKKELLTTILASAILAGCSDKNESPLTTSTTYKPATRVTIPTTTTTLKRIVGIDGFSQEELGDLSELVLSPEEELQKFLIKDSEVPKEYKKYARNLPKEEIRNILILSRFYGKTQDACFSQKVCDFSRDNIQERNITNVIKTNSPRALYIAKKGDTLLIFFPERISQNGRIIPNFNEGKPLYEQDEREIVALADNWARSIKAERAYVPERLKKYLEQK